MSLATATPDTLYGPAGWVRSRGVEALLEPYFLPHQSVPSFARFEGVGGDVAAALTPLLPAENLDESQNNAPHLRHLLAAALNHPGVTLAGYLVSAPRWDERLSVDGLHVPVTFLSSPQKPQLWDLFRHTLGLHSARSAPDEMHLVTLSDGTPAWWLWWD